MKLPSPLSRLVSAYITTLRFVAGTSMAIIVLVMIAQVWSRYVMGGSLIWAEELCRYLLMWQTFLVLGLAYSKGEFVAIDFLPSHLSARGKWVLKAICAIPIIVFLALITMYGAEYASRFSNQTIPALDFIWGSLFGHPLGLHIGYIYISVSVGCALMILHVAADVVTSFGPQMRSAHQNGLDESNNTTEIGGRQG
ncbi:tripartite ATP-independent periplasmic transporter, DctQ component (plasmid) [Pseudosulfitobacter pseudonitzschiae]|uniref:TRAP transporter small permease protein n=2 Tax=Rhodobacterales TaxID=204455 RepID=A0A221K801_9RHOB|nr:tripartite ATP-independent periplasmic transporter, DctQ component [Pseudosulfitobacter pseudonitzschiae]